MKPTTVATEMAWPSAHTSQKPPMSENGTAAITSAGVPEGTEEQVQQHEDDGQRRRHDDLQPLASRARGTRTAPTTTPRSPAGIATCRATAACMSCTTERRSRPRTST